MKASKYILDDTDTEILNLLQKDGRLSHKQLAALTNKSITPIHIRVRRLEELGYIKQFAALLNPNMLGLGLIGYTQVILEKHTEESLTTFMVEVAKLDEIMECYHMTGAFDFLLRIAIHDMEEYSMILMKKLSNLPGVKHFESFFVMSEIKHETAYILK
jgi:Lrp/AsnC family transcriptional regulator, leucine-responsive regulatory protein